MYGNKMMEKLIIALQVVFYWQNIESMNSAFVKKSEISSGGTSFKGSCRTT